MTQLPEKYYWATDFRTLDGVTFDNWLDRYKKAKHKELLAAKRLRRAMNEPVKEGWLFPEPPVARPKINYNVGFIGNCKPQPQVVYNF